MGVPNTDVIKTISELIEGIHSSRAAIFCGAGISRNSGIPVINELIPYVIQTLKMPIPVLYHFQSGPE